MRDDMKLQSTITILPDGPVTIVRLPGVPEPGAGNVALFAAARHVTAGRHADATRVFVTGPGATATALWVARAGADVTYWTENTAEGQSLIASFAHNHLPVAQTFVQADFAGLEPTTCDAAFVHLARGRELQEEALRLAAAMLRPSGRLVFAGATREGVKSALQQARMIFGQTGIVVRKAGYHAGLAQRPDGNFPFPTIQRTECDIDVDDVLTRLVSYAGTFAPARLDVGAAALIAAMQIPSGARVLDLGCGTGLAGLAALRRGADVIMTDVSARAVMSAQETLAANGYPDTSITHACGAATVETATLDIVITNPPFHQGHGLHFEVAQFFIAEAARVLKAGGKLYLVANVFLGYEPWLRAHFARVQQVWNDRRFCVWEATK